MLWCWALFDPICPLKFREDYFIHFINLLDPLDLTFPESS